MSTPGPPTPRPRRVLVVDDHTLFRRGVRTLLATYPELEVVGECGTADEALTLVAALAPDVVLLDLAMPGTHGLAAIGALLTASPGTQVCVLTMADDDASVVAALRAGARGYVTKDADGDEFVAAVVAVSRGAAVFSPSVGARLAAFVDPGARTRLPFPDLTASERAVLTLIAAGRDNATIARELCLSPKTVRNYITSVFRKLGVTDRARAIVVAREAGITGPAGPDRPPARGARANG